jgi:hypothetical protein
LRDIGVAGAAKQRVDLQPVVTGGGECAILRSPKKSGRQRRLNQGEEHHVEAIEVGPRHPA